MAQYQLSILTPEGQAYHGPAEETVAPGMLGIFGVQAKHAAMMAQLKKGILRLKLNQQERYFAVGDGIFEVDPKSNAVALVDWAVECTNLQQAKDKVFEKSK